MLAWIAGILFAIWLFFRVVSQLVMWPSKMQDASNCRDFLYGALGMIFAGLVLNGVMWCYGAQ